MLVRGRKNRPGLSLLEVLVALTILLFSLIAIGHLITFGNDRALESRFYQQAAFLCQSKLAELAIGEVALQNQSDQSFTDANADWNWSVDCNQVTDVDGLWRVQVTVSRDMPTGEKLSVSLNKFLIDPGSRGSTFDSPPDPMVQLDPNYTPPPSSSKSSQGTANSGGSSSSGTSKTGGTPPMGTGPKTGGPGGPTAGGTKTGPTMGGTPGGGAKGATGTGNKTTGPTKTGKGG
jgi:hypothetical protein